MTLTEAIKARRSVRKYKKAELTREQIEGLLEAAMEAPSAGNSRQWEFVVVRNRAKLEEMMKAHPYAGMLKTASLAIVVCGIPEKSVPAMAPFFPQDCGAATENILLKAVELGLGTCWCGVYPDEGRTEALRKILGVKSVPFNIIAVGVPDEEPKAKGFFDAAKVTYID